jgi:uncharacterized protein
MHRSRLAHAALSISLLAALAATVVAAGAPTLDELRKRGVVGERYDGLVVARTEPLDSAARALVDSVNSKRRQIYEERAKKQGVSPEQVGKVYALELSKAAPAGTWFLGEDGRWVQKR